MEGIPEMICQIIWNIEHSMKNGKVNYANDSILKMQHFQLSQCQMLSQKDVGTLKYHLCEVLELSLVLALQLREGSKHLITMF